MVRQRRLSALRRAARIGRSDKALERGKTAEALRGVDVCPVRPSDTSHDIDGDGPAVAAVDDRVDRTQVAERRGRSAWSQRAAQSSRRRRPVTQQIDAEFEFAPMKLDLLPAPIELAQATVTAAVCFDLAMESSPIAGRDRSEVELEQLEKQDGGIDPHGREAAVVTIVEALLLRLPLRLILGGGHEPLPRRPKQTVRAASVLADAVREQLDRPAVAPDPNRRGRLMMTQRLLKKPHLPACLGIRVVRRRVANDFVLEERVPIVICRA